MQPTAEDWQKWETAALLQLGFAVRSARAEVGLSQRALAEAAGVDRGQIANIESTNKDGTPRLSDLPRLAILIRLALALQIPPIMLLYPKAPDGAVDVIPGVTTSSIGAARWFSGETSLDGIGESGRLTFFTSRKLELMKLSRERDDANDLVSVALRAVDAADVQLTAAQRKKLDAADQELAAIEKRIKELGGYIDDGESDD